MNIPVPKIQVTGPKIEKAKEKSEKIKRNKFENFNMTGPIDVSESNVISVKIENEEPHINLENSDISNRHLDEAMISTVMSQQLETGEFKNDFLASKKSKKSGKR